MTKKIIAILVGAVVVVGIVTAVIYINKNYVSKGSNSENVEIVEETKKPTEEVKKDSTDDLRVKMLNKFEGKAPFKNAEKHLEIPTYFPENNQAIHPSVFYDATKKFGHKWIMAFTPYSFIKDDTENPSIVVSEDGINWEEPKGIKNPLAITENGNVHHYSDTEIFTNGDELELWYRESDKVIHKSRILRRKSKDAVNWSEPEVIFDYGTGGYGYGAPTVVYGDDGTYEIFYREHMSYGAEGYERRLYKDGKVVGENQKMVFEYSPEYQNFVAWHIEVRKIKDKYYCLAMSFPKDQTMTGGNLFLFTSDDGINYKDMKLIMTPSKDGFDNNTMYKSSMVVGANFVNLYYSSISKNSESYISLVNIKE